jgi:hypothetical protein
MRSALDEKDMERQYMCVEHVHVSDGGQAALELWAKVGDGVKE